MNVQNLIYVRAARQLGSCLRFSSAFRAPTGVPWTKKV